MRFAVADAWKAPFAIPVDETWGSEKWVAPFAISFVGKSISSCGRTPKELVTDFATRLAKFNS
jgi:hypothetical protein